VVGVICLRVNGFGMKATLCMSQKIVASSIRDFGVGRMEDLISFTPSGGGNPKPATCPGTHNYLALFSPYISHFRSKKR